MCVEGLRHRLQHGTGDAPAADQHCSNDQHKKERQHDTDPHRLRLQFLTPR
jgi:hypothetical protein